MRSEDVHNVLLTRSWARRADQDTFARWKLRRRLADFGEVKDQRGGELKVVSDCMVISSVVRFPVPKALIPVASRVMECRG